MVYGLTGQKQAHAVSVVAREPKNSPGNAITQHLPMAEATAWEKALNKDPAAWESVR